MKSLSVESGETFSLVVRLEGGQTTLVRDEMAHRHPLLVRARPLREIALHRRIEIDLSALDELHHRRRHADDLGERCEIPERRGRGARRLRPVEMPCRDRHERTRVRADHGHRAGKCAVAHGVVENGLQRCAQRVTNRARHARFRGRGARGSFRAARSAVREREWARVPARTPAAKREEERRCIGGCSDLGEKSTRPLGRRCRTHYIPRHCATE